MKEVAIMTDSISGIPPEMARDLDIKVIPLYVTLDGTTVVETEVNSEQLYSRLAQKENLPTTSSPSAEDFLRAYRDLSRKAKYILHISFSSRLGMSYKEAMIAKGIAEKDMPDISIEVIDTYTAHGAQLLCVLEASRAAIAGKRLPEIVTRIEKLLPELNLLYSLDTIYYLKKGGRMSKSDTWSETNLRSNILMELSASTGGNIVPFARTRTRARATEKMLNIVEQRNKKGKLHVVIGHDGDPRQAEDLKRQFLSLFPVEEIYITGVSFITAVHDGPGAMHLSWFNE
jgi:DegV family protein with EDD domain